MDRERALRQRMATQRLASAPLPHAEDAVRLLACVQSQERDHAFYSLGLRSRATTYAAVRAEFDRGAFVRTHILRPTWHFVAPEDLRWILELTSPRVVQAMAGRHRQLGLDDAATGRALETLHRLLANRNVLNRKQIGDHFTHMGLPNSGEQVGHLLMIAELRGLICSGPIVGVQHTYGLVEELIPPTKRISRHASLVELARRFFAGHGPATVKDFTRWSSLTVADAKAALGSIGGGLEQVRIDGIPHWFDPSLPRRYTGGRAAYLLPVYDEAYLTYPSVNFAVAEGHPNGTGFDQWWAPVVLDETNHGVWKRTVGADAVTVQVQLAPSVEAGAKELVEEAAQRMAAFLERDLELAFD